MKVKTSRLLVIFAIVAVAAILAIAFSDAGKNSYTESSILRAEDIPKYSGSPFVAVNNGTPQFSKSELKEQGYEEYSRLDSLGRTRTAFACLGMETMPKDGEKRGNISHIKPSGWVQKTYSSIKNGQALYNRCHLIGWQLSAENANEKNLVTGTEYMNNKGMLPFENMVADYIKETSNHVAYRVTPIYRENDLLCLGVQIEAYSVEDSGEGICFNVFCYNVQPGIEIDYKTGESHEKSNTSTSEEISEIEKFVWIASENSTKYHSKSTCSGMKSPIKLTEEQAKSMGLTPCGKCN